MNSNDELHCKNQMQPQSESGVSLAEITDGILFGTRARIADKPVMSMPIAELATLGAGVASLLPAFRTVTQTTTVHADGLYRLANAAVGDTLKMAKNGNFWAAFKTADGTSKFAQLQSAAFVPASTTMIMPIDPATVMMAVALFSIEQKLDSIEEMERQILSFLEIEKEAEIEADLETLSSIIKKYKFNWDNEHFVASNHKLVLDIERTARKHINSYQKKVTDVLNSKKLLVSHGQVSAALNDLLRKFRYYRLSVYIFAMATFIELILSGDFKEENIRCARNEIETTSATYRDIFGRCSVYLEKLSDTAFETNLLKGLGTASKAVGKAIEHIPVVSQGPVDEFLQGRGQQMSESALQLEKKTVGAFAEPSNPGVGIFVEKMDDLTRIYGQTKEIYFDDKRIYLVAG
jgi:hypothetical protein